jgi:hypothetical protein
MCRLPDGPIFSASTYHRMGRAATNTQPIRLESGRGGRKDRDTIAASAMGCNFLGTRFLRVGAFTLIDIQQVTGFAAVGATKGLGELASDAIETCLVRTSLDAAYARKRQ